MEYVNEYISNIKDNYNNPESRFFIYLFYFIMFLIVIQAIGVLVNILVVLRNFLLNTRSSYIDKLEEKKTN